MEYYRNSFNNNYEEQLENNNIQNYNSDIMTNSINRKKRGTENNVYSNNEVLMKIDSNNNDIITNSHKNKRNVELNKNNNEKSLIRNRTSDDLISKEDIIMAKLHLENGIKPIQREGHGEDSLIKIRNERQATPQGEFTSVTGM